MKRKILLSESISVNAILQQCNIGVCSSFDAYTTKEEHFYHTKQDGWNFNPDMLICFVDETELYSSGNTTCGMAGTIPFIIGGTEVYVRIKKNGNTLCTLEQMFGTYTRINDYITYIDAFNENLNRTSRGISLPKLPIRRVKNKKCYFRFWVFKDIITALYYPDSPLPRYDCETIEFHRSDDGGTNLLQNDGKIIAIDSWMRNTVRDNVPKDKKLFILPKTSQ